MLTTVRALLPDERELVVRAHLDVEHLLRRLRLQLFLGLGGPGTCASALMRAMCDHTAVMRRNEMQHHQQVDDRDHVDLAVDRPSPAFATAVYVYATHEVCSFASLAGDAARPLDSLRPRFVPADLEARDTELRDAAQRLRRRRG